MHATIYWTPDEVAATTYNSSNWYFRQFFTFSYKKKNKIMFYNQTVWLERVGQTCQTSALVQDFTLSASRLKVSFRQMCGKRFPCKDKHFYIPLRGHANSLFAFQRWMAAKCLVALWGSKRAKTSSRPCDLLMTWQEGKHTSASFKLALCTGSRSFFARHFKITTIRHTRL